jgi:hypothetical protein
MDMITMALLYMERSCYFPLTILACIDLFFFFIESLNARKFCRFCEPSKGEKKFLES